ncbi:MAG: AraC family transcriptional regulator [Ardenticatenaceae bacterium]|nr:AraC family transcriptional regulator [Ardenticatenaceae bacterium]
MKVLPPNPQMSSYIEAYYFTSLNMLQPYPIVHFPAISCSHLKFSTQSGILTGQTTRPTEIASDLDTTGFGIKLRIGAVYALFDIPAYEITNCVINLEDILGNSASELVERASEASTPLEKTRHVERIFMRLAQRNRKKNFSPELAVLEALTNSHFSTLSCLAEQFGYSSRQLQRKLKNFIGLTPTLFKRISRFEKALQLIQPPVSKGNFAWCDIAFRCGYSDQAHFIRDFREFTGYSPTAYVADLEMSDSFNTRE